MIAPQPYFSARGTPFSVLHRIRALLTHGHCVDLLTYGYGEDIELPPLEGKLKILRSCKIPGIKNIKIGPSIPKIFLDFMLYYKTRKALKNTSYDLIHSHEEAAFWAMPLSKKHGLPHLYDMHSSLPQQLSNFKTFNATPFRQLFERLENKVLDTCSGVITICDELGQLVEKQAPSKPHKMIENIGDDAKVFSADDENVIAQFGLNTKKVILYTGTFEAYQGINLLLESLVHLRKKHPNIIAMLVGGNNKQINEYRKMAERLGVLDIVRFSGIVKPTQIPNFISAATVIVSPRSRGTNTPLKIYNYLRRGVPLVATDRLTHTQILNSEISCLVEATPEGFAKGIASVLADSNYALQLANNAQQFAEKHFSDDDYIEMVNSAVSDTMLAFYSLKRGVNEY